MTINTNVDAFAEFLGEEMRKLTDAANTALSVQTSSYLSAFDYGVSTDSTPEDNLAGMNTAMLQAVATGKVLAGFETGVIELSDQPTVPTGLKMVDPTHGGVVLRFSDTAPNVACMLGGPMATVAEPSPAIVEDVYIEGFTLDGNWARDGGTIDPHRPGGSGAATGYIRNWTFYKTAAFGFKLHGFDTCNGGRLVGSQRYYEDPAYGKESLGVLRSYGVKLIECKSWDNGDDNFTWHYCDAYEAFRCWSGESSGRHPSLAGGNSYEIDDGAGDGSITYCTTVGPANTGIAVKCHDDYAAPNDVTVAFNTISGVARGIYLNDPNDDGVSSSATRVRVLYNRIKEPLFFDKPNNGLRSTTDLYGIAAGEYTGAMIVGNHITGDGLMLSESYTEEGEARTRQTESGIDLSSGLNAAVVSHNIVENWATANSSDAGVAGIKLTSSVVNSVITHNVVRDCGYRGYVDTSGDTSNILSNNLFILSNLIAGSIAVRLSTEGSNSSDSLHNNVAVGFEYGLSIADTEYTELQDYGVVSSLKSSFDGRSSADYLVTTAMHIVDSYVEDHDLLDEFNASTGVFTATTAGVHEFHGVISFTDGDGTDDTASIQIAKNGTAVRALPINPRALSDTGIEYTESVSARLLLEVGDTVDLRLDGVIDTSPVGLKEALFSGGAI